ncbi:MAG: hypothetical protein KC505_01165 [Myxococcales bacterium]|nr:hypothetical protein [Myxococcales bacterium]
MMTFVSGCKNIQHKVVPAFKLASESISQNIPGPIFFINKDKNRTLSIDPETLEICLIGDEGKIVLSHSQNKIPIKIISKTRDIFVFSRDGLLFTTAIRRDKITVKISNISKQPANLIFPSLETKDQFLLPILEGVMISPHSKSWMSYMGSHTRELIELFSFPAWGLRTSAETFSYLIEDPIETEAINLESKENEYQKSLHIQNKINQFAKSFPGGVLEATQNWGNSVSPWIIQQLEKSGIKRAWLGVNSFEHAKNHIGFITAAVEKNYLVGAYDSYHSMHDPNNSEWPTANLGSKVFKESRITTSTGIQSKGFLGKGFHVNSKYIRSYFENITGNQISIGFNSWFIDCDGAGELFSNYGEMYPMTQAEDRQERIDRLQWLERNYKIVVGTEGARSYIVPSVHFAHGTLTPPFTYSFKQIFCERYSMEFLPYFMSIEVSG